MTRLRILLAPLALLLIGAAAAAESAGSIAAGSANSLTEAKAPPPGWRAPVWRQVRIEQHLIIRIIPGPTIIPPAEVEQFEEQQRTVRLAERKIGKCLAVASIATLEPGDSNELLLFLHDDRVIGATLEKHCSARDFYAGFYVERHPDGAICAGRDTLQSRSGANCKVRRLHELVTTGYRRFP
jgi:hypothetical protein